MKGLEFERLVEGKVMECIAVLSSKSEEYATDEDRLHNFKVAAEVTGKTPVQALAGMMAKHTVSIYDLCNEDVDFVIPLKLWDEKITDHINYLLLLWGLVYEQNQLHPFDIDSNESPFKVANNPFLNNGSYDTVDIPLTRMSNNCHCSQKKPTP